MATKLKDKAAITIDKLSDFDENEGPGLTMLDKLVH
jgi:hypothetical protein